MPDLHIKSVEYFSSEDPSFPAKNLLISKKWKCEKPGEKSEFVVLRLEAPAVINGIDIGNEHSMFVTVSVGKYGSNREFQEILLTSSFMTGIESRNSEKINRVRCFDQNALIESVAKHKWDLIKVLCTQIVNKHVKYGLCFIKLRGIIDKIEEPKSSFGNLGKFKIREDSPDSESDNASSSLFNRWKQSKQNPTTLTTAAAIREASNPSSLKNYKSLINKEKVVKPIETPNPLLVIPDSDDEDNIGRHRDKLFYNKEDDEPNEKFEKKLAEDNARKERNKTINNIETNKKTDDNDSDKSSIKKIDTHKKVENNSKKDDSKITKSIDANDKLKASSSKFKSFITLKDEKSSPKLLSPSVKSNFYSKSPSSTKKRPLSPLEFVEPKRVKVKREPVYRKFNKLLDGVVYVISGIQNPERSELRKKASELGADYRQDWEEGCTHLICAFANTPKFRQVKGNGKIVKKDWIHKCHSLKKHIPWRQYALDKQDASKSDSEDEILELFEKPSTSSVSSPVNNNEKKISENYDVDDNDDDASGGMVIDSGSDTEEEIERVVEDNRKKTKYIDLFDKSTDEENDETTDQSSIKMSQPQSSKGFFKHKSFMLHENLGAIDVIKLKSFIIQQKGKITEKINHANYVISNTQVSVSSTFSGEILKPRWIYECMDMDCLLPLNRYKL